ncbi:MAG: ABC-2 type transport system ATP-binding protein [Saprospiraceae bacterium]|jgi:ABC-2 type transport system ATP-binding protein
MNITLDNISKRYTSNWILRNVNYEFSEDHVYAIKGDNGSGKSTLLKMISGLLSPSVGSINYQDVDKKISNEEVYRHVSYWGPYVSLLKNLSVVEMISYYIKNKPLRNTQSVLEIFHNMNVNVSPKSIAKSLSSGQIQRVGLYLTILSDSSILLLDEPGSYLDQEGKNWYQELLKREQSNRIVIIASNEEGDMRLADKSLTISDFH